MIGKWHDGQAIYRKWIQLDISSYSEAIDRRSFSITLDSTIDRVINFNGYFIIATSTDSTRIGYIFTLDSCYPNPDMTVVVGSMIEDTGSGMNLVIYINSEFQVTAIMGWACIEYIKS